MRTGLRRLAYRLILASGAGLLAACGGGEGTTAHTSRPPKLDETGRDSNGAPGRLLVYVGTYTNGASHGIYRVTFDSATGAVTGPALAGEAKNPSFLALHPNGRVLYAVNEVATFEGGPTGAVSAFAIDAASHDLTLLNRQPSGGADPCHLAIDAAARNVLVANYTGGSVSALPIQDDGRLQPPSTVRRHAGRGPNAVRQARPHAHAVALDAAGRFAFAADLGADRIFIYRFDPGQGTLVPNDPQAVALEPGSGPRHLAWHPSGQYLYAVNELRSTVTAFQYDAARGALRAIQTLSTLPPGFHGRNTTAEIAITPDARVLIVSNRGHDSISTFAVDGPTGTLTPGWIVPTGGRTPRHFALDPSGRWLLVANQDSDSITVFQLDPASGRPGVVGVPLAVPTPVCLLFATPAAR